VAFLPRRTCLGESQHPRKNYLEKGSEKRCGDYGDVCEFEGDGRMKGQNCDGVGGDDEVARHRRRDHEIRLRLLHLLQPALGIVRYTSIWMGRESRDQRNREERVSVGRSCGFSLSGEKKRERGGRS
jgi:hypothetical protein